MRSDEPDEMTDHITDFVFFSGSWGNQDSKTTSVGVRDQSHQRGSVSAKLRYFLRHAFPDVLTLRDKYTVLKKAPWLLPLVWIYRPVYKLLNKKEHGFLLRHSRGWKNLDPAKLKDRRQALEYVGLDYNFEGM